MNKKQDVCISHILFPWETFEEQKEREKREKENNGSRWTDEFCKEVREHILRYSKLEEVALRSASLYEIYKLVPVHLRGELFNGISLPMWR